MKLEKMMSDEDYAKANKAHKAYSKAYKQCKNKTGFKPHDSGMKAYRKTMERG